MKIDGEQGGEDDLMELEGRRQCRTTERVDVESYLMEKKLSG